MTAGTEILTATWRACRQLRRTRTFTVASIATISVAVGSFAGILGFAESLWLRPPPVGDPSRLAILYSRLRSGAGVISDVVSLGDAGRLTSHLNSAEGVAFEVNERLPGRRPQFTLDGGRAVQGAGVSGNYFEVLGLRLRGRGFLASEELPAAAPVAVISHHLWDREYGRRASIVGGTIGVNGMPYTVVGVGPPGFRGPRRGDALDIWVPVQGTAALIPFLTPETFRRDYSRIPVRLYVRLRDRGALARAETEIAGQLPSRSRNWSLRTLTDTSYPVEALARERDDQRLIALMGGMAGTLLCAGVINLVGLASASRGCRRREAAIKVALGARSRDLALESWAQAAASGVLGGLGAIVVGRALATAIGSFALPTGLTFAMIDSGTSAGHLFFTLGLSVVLVLAVNAGFGVAASYRYADAAILSASGRTLASGRWILRYGLLASHVAASIVLLVAAALLARSARQAVGKDLGFTRQAVFVEVVPNIARYANRTANDIDFGRRLADFRSFTSHVAALPGIAGVVEGGSPLHDPITAARGLTPRALANGSDVIELPYLVVDVGAWYFSRLGIPILAGRELMPEDAPSGTSQPVVITADLARRLWPNGQSVGARIVTADSAPVAPMTFEVVGVAANAVRHGVRGEPLHAVFRLVQHDPERDMATPTFCLAVVTATPPTAAKPLVAALAREAFPAAYTLRVDTVEERVESQTAAERLGATLLGCLGLAALVICVIGVFSLASHVSSTRLREAALRMAVGGPPLKVLLTLTARLWLAALAGGGAGAVLAASMSPALRPYLHGLHVLDPVSYVAAVSAVLGSAAAAALSPMRRLARVDLSQLLRSQTSAIG